MTYDLPPGNYTVENFFDYVSRVFERGSSGTLQKECVYSSIKTQLITQKSTVRFDEKTFFSSLLGCTPFWITRVLWTLRTLNEYAIQKFYDTSTID